MEVNFSLPKASDHNTRSTYPQFFAWNKTGYNNKHLFHEMNEKFSDLWITREPSLHCYLFGDQLGAHKDQTTIAYVFDRYVMMFLLLVNSSHYLQPLDNYAFGSFKLELSWLSSMMNNACLFNPNEVQALLNSICYEAE